MILRDFLPSPALREYVRKHQIIKFDFGPGVILPYKVYSPRPETCLVFNLRDPQTVRYPQNAGILTHPKCTIIGQHTVVTNKYIGREFFTLQIVLQPSSLFRLTGIPCYELANTFMDAESIWGKKIREAFEQMCNLEETEEIIKIAESFILKAINQSNQQLHRIDQVSSLILYQNQPLTMDILADHACLSSRQFYRKFSERVGIGPKVFDKVVRFQKAFFMKNANPDLDWLSIAIACGYYDYQHLSKDYKFFTTMTPSGFYEVDTRAPERTFGVVEVSET